MTNSTVATTGVAEAREPDHAHAGRPARTRTVRRLIGGAAALTALALGISSTDASADSCHGDIVGKSIASEWPFAHEDRDDFAPPTGGFARWVETFGLEDQPGAENQAIRDSCRT